MINFKYIIRSFDLENIKFEQYLQKTIFFFFFVFFISSLRNIYYK